MGSGRSSRKVPPPPVEAPRRFQMRVVTTPTVRRRFLEICKRENVIPNRILGRYIERAVKRGYP